MVKGSGKELGSLVTRVQIPATAPTALSLRRGEDEDIHHVYWPMGGDWEGARQVLRKDQARHLHDSGKRVDRPEMLVEVEAEAIEE
jgi:hypothetical protein